MPILWIAFIVFILCLLALDLGVFHRRVHAVSVRESLIWVGVWVSLSLLFSIFIYFLYEYRPAGINIHNSMGGQEAAVFYLTGYVIEQSLSMDNMFVIAMILGFFRVPAELQHRVLFWGILGAIAMRAGMIFGGVMLVARFEWVLYIFGAFLIFSAWRMVFGAQKMDPRKSFLIRQVRRHLPLTGDFHGRHFVVRVDGRLAGTPLLLALLAVESADVVFAVDSIPAIFAITQEPFLIFTSNVFAILGLRSLYFALAGMLEKFRYLKYSLAVLLALIGVKMLLREYLHDVPGLIYITLGVILLVLAAGVIVSLIRMRNCKQSDSSSN